MRATPNMAGLQVMLLYEYMERFLSLGYYRTAGYLAAGITTARDHLETLGDVGLSPSVYKAELVLSQYVMAVERMSINHGRREMSWLMIYLPEPAWEAFQKTSQGQVRLVTPLADPIWTAAVTAYTRVMAALPEVSRRSPYPPPNRKLPGKGKSGAGKKAEGEMGQQAHHLQSKTAHFVGVAPRSPSAAASSTWATRAFSDSFLLRERVSPTTLVPVLRRCLAVPHTAIPPQFGRCRHHSPGQPNVPHLAAAIADDVGKSADGLRSLRI